MFDVDVILCNRTAKLPVKILNFKAPDVIQKERLSKEVVLVRIVPKPV